MKKSILITGSGTGIGRDTAIELAQRGHRVYATTHTQEQADRLNNLSNMENIELISFKLDIKNSKDRLLVHEYDIDVLINNAAVGETGSAAEIPMEKFKEPFKTNVFSALALTQETIKDMINRKSGRILFISSIAGRMSMPFFSPYSATKYALEAIGASLNDEMELLRVKGIDISVSIIEPGAYATGFNQKMMETKYEWMDNTSYFSGLIKKIKKREEKKFNKIELRSNKTIVKEITKAVEEKTPKLRYFSPKIQASAVQLMRILGK